MKNKLVIPSLRGVVGEWIYYSSLMSAKQINEWILAAKDIRESKSLDEILQRDLNERKKTIANYILTDPRHFFNSIIVGVFEGLPDWLEFDLSKTENIIGYTENLEEIKNSIGLLIFNGDEQMFAIDGQHRVAGIQIAYEEDIKKNIENQAINDDQFSVLFIAHIDDESGKKRTRKLFSDINKNAKPVAQGDKIKIDEEDLSAIVTRRIYANNKYFKNTSLISLTERESLEAKDTVHFTNLLGIYNVVKALRKLYKKKPKTFDWEEENVQNLYNLTESFFNFAIENIADYKSFFIDNTLQLSLARQNNKNILFRPIGLKLIANLYVHFYHKQVKLKSKINKISFIMPNSPFNNIVWNKGRMEAREANQNMALELSIYLLDNIHIERKKVLLEKYRTFLKNPKAVLPKKV